MKKLIAAALSAVMTFSGIAASAEGIPEDFNENAVLVNYNGDLISFGGIKPKNVDGRIMLPFREALENIGATVDYDDATRLVTAAKGDVTVTFTLLDDTIYVSDNGGEKSQIKMDVPMIVEDGNTLVPIRFLSEAFGMDVGWSDEWLGCGTVLILDKEQLISDFKKIAPNFIKLTELSYPKFNSEHDEISLDIGTTGQYIDGMPRMAFDLIKSGMIADTVIGENASEITASLNADVFLGGGTLKINDAVIDVIISDGVIYIKTDALEKAEVKTTLGEESPDFEAARDLFASDKWYSIDLNAIMDKLALPEGTMDIYLNALNNPGSYKPTIDDVLSRVFTSDGEPDKFQMMSIKSMLDAYKMIDKCITVTESDSGYDISVIINNDAIINMLRESFEQYGYESLDEIITRINNAFDLDINMKSKLDSETLSSTGNVTVSVNDGDVKNDVKMTIDMQAGIDDKITEPEIPAESIDLLQIFEKYRLNKTA